MSKSSNKKVEGDKSEKKKDSSICCLQKIHFRPKETDWDWKNWKRYSTTNGSSKKAGAGILITNKIDFKL